MRDDRYDTSRLECNEDRLGTETRYGNGRTAGVGPRRAQFGHSSTSALIKFDHSAGTPYCALGRRNASIVKSSGTTIFLDPQTGHAPDIVSVILGFRLIKHPWNGVRMEFQLHKGHVFQTRQRWRVRAA